MSPEPTIKAKLVLDTTDRSVSSSLPSMGDSDKQEERKAFKTINKFLPLGAISSTTMLGAGMMALFSKLMKEGFDADPNIKKWRDSINNGTPLFDNKEEELKKKKQDEIDLLNRFLESGQMGDEGLRQMADGTVELRDQTGKLVAVFGDGEMSIKESIMNMVENNKMLGIELNELQKTMATANGIILSSANNLQSGVTAAIEKIEKITAGSIIKSSSSRSVSDIRANTYAKLGMDASAQKADNDYWNKAAEKAIIRRIK